MLTPRYGHPASRSEAIVAVLKARYLMTGISVAPTAPAEADEILVALITHHQDTLTGCSTREQLRTELREVAISEDWFMSLDLLQVGENLPESPRENAESISVLLDARSVAEVRIVDRMVALIERGNTPVEMEVSA